MYDKSVLGRDALSPEGHHCSSGSQIRVRAGGGATVIAIARIRSSGTRWGSSWGVELSVVQAGVDSCRVRIHVSLIVCVGASVS